MMKIKLTFCICTILSFALNSMAQQSIKPTLNQQSLQAVNRTFSLLPNNDGRTIVHLNGQPNAGVVWII